MKRLIGIVGIVLLVLVVVSVANPSLFEFLQIRQQSPLPDTITVYAYGANGLVSKQKGSDVSYYHQDNLGSSSLVTDEDGVVKYSTDYYPFGSSLHEEGEEKYTYNSKELDSTGLHYYGARYYDSSIGRFISVDPVSGNIFNPQRLNRYSYTLNNPLKYVDPSGAQFVFASEGAEVELSILKDIPYYNLMDDRCARAGVCVSVDLYRPSVEETSMEGFTGRTLGSFRFVEPFEMKIRPEVLRDRGKMEKVLYHELTHLNNHLREGFGIIQRGGENSMQNRAIEEIVTGVATLNFLFSQEDFDFDLARSEMDYLAQNVFEFFHFSSVGTVVSSQYVARDGSYILIDTRWKPEMTATETRVLAIYKQAQTKYWDNTGRSFTEDQTSEFMAANPSLFDNLE